MERISVCLVDDNPELVSLMEEYFDEQEDIEVIGTASNGKECLEMLEVLEPDILILDIIMPHIDGIAVLNQLKSMELTKTPQVIMLTAFGQEEVMKKAVEFGASYFILKPFDLDHLADRIRTINTNTEFKTKVPKQKKVTKTHLAGLSQALA